MSSNSPSLATSPPANRFATASLRFWQAAAVALALAGIAARVLDYAARRSLWVDEAAIADNVLSRRIAQLFDRLDYAQVAAPGFLLWVKACARLLGSGELALRLPSFVAGCCALFFMFLLARRMMRGPGLPLAVGLLAFGELARTYSAELKPYSTDLAVLLAVTWAARAVVVDGASRTKLTTLAIFGAAAPWLSEAAPLALAGAGAALGVNLLRRRQGREARMFAWALAAPALSQLAAFALSKRNSSAADLHYLRDYFAPDFLPRGAAALPWLRTCLLYLVQLATDTPLPLAAAALTIAGLVLLARRRLEDLGLICAPLAAALSASILQLYPFEARLMLVLVPAVILPVATAVDWLWFLAGKLRWPARAISVAVSLALLVPPAQALGTTMHEREEMRPALAHLLPRLEPDDLLYVYYGGHRAFSYYSEQFGIAPNRYQMGRCARGEPRRYLDELETLHGHRRVWLLLIHPFRGLGVDEGALFEAAFAKLGTQLDRFDVSGGFAALYQLRPEPIQLADLPLPPSGDDAQLTRTCYGTHGP